MFWLLLATGFTGGMTFLFVARWVVNWLTPPPAAAVHFSPKGGCADRVVREIGRARREILVLAYSFSSKPIAQALIDAHRRGVTVEVVLDHSNEHEEYSDLPLMLEAGLKPLVDTHHAIAHNKVMLIDRTTLLTGSFNFTHQAEVENAENLLVLHHHRELIAAYHDNFRAHHDHARAAQPGAAAPARQPHRRAA
jgi:phosphatidylserine/phosphatidylglycerophosphate/cardiolipin synthase-like enzyme